MNRIHIQPRQPIAENTQPGHGTTDVNPTAESGHPVSNLELDHLPGDEDSMSIVSAYVSFN